MPPKGPKPNRQCRGRPRQRLPSDPVSTLAPNDLAIARRLAQPPPNDVAEGNHHESSRGREGDVEGERLVQHVAWLAAMSDTVAFPTIKVEVAEAGPVVVTAYVFQERGCGAVFVFCVVWAAAATPNEVSIGRTRWLYVATTHMRPLHDLSYRPIHVDISALAWIHDPTCGSFTFQL